jgi:hypothetical protein
LTTGTCPALIRTAAECFEGATTLGISPKLITSNATINDKTQPKGCFLMSKGSTFSAVFNNATDDGATCGSSTHVAGSTKSLVELTVDLEAKNNTATITMAVRVPGVLVIVLVIIF